MNINEILNFKLIHTDNYTLTVYQVIFVLIMLFASKYIIQYVLKLFELAVKRKGHIDTGRSYTYQKFISYFLYIIIGFFILQNIGVNMSMVLAGSAALMVGIGFGLQQTANDFISGIILLFEGSIKKGDVLSVDGEIGSVVEIGIRTTELNTLDHKVIILPNSKLVNNNIINWSHTNNVTRFKIGIGVAYGSDIAQVEAVLMDCLSKDLRILKKPGPFVRFSNFGDSSLDFELYFFSQALLDVEDIKGKMRKLIYTNLNKNHIAIPFPQRDLWIKQVPASNHLNNPIELDNQLV